MQLIKSCFSFIIIISLTFIFSSCSDDENPIIVQGIRGVVFDNYGNVIPNIKVSVNYGPAVNTSQEGTFFFANIDIPYDLNIFFNDGSLFYQYRGLTEKNPRVSLPVNYSGTFEKHATINLNYPKLSKEDKVFINFLCEFNTQAYFFRQSDSSCIITVYWSGSNSISGRLNFIQHRRNKTGEITGYEKIGYKQMSLIDTMSYNSIFESSEFINPSQDPIIISPAIVSANYYLNARMYFQGYKYTSPIAIVTSSNLPLYNLMIPVSSLYNIKVGYDFVSYDTIQGNTIKAWGLISGGQNYQFQIPASVELLYPADDTIGVSQNTEFNVSEMGSVYEFHFGNYSVFTQQNYAKIPISEIYGIPFPYNSNLEWYVRKYNVSNINDLVAEYDPSYRDYHRVTLKTNSRSFTTIPNN